MNKNPKYTVIVPIYNAEATLQRCIDSILAQTYSGFELILVNDGSSDRSAVIIDHYAAADSRIRAIHKPNGGVSTARNAALDIARGKYVLFIDSDDYIDTTYLEKFNIVNSVCDELVIASVSIVDETGNQVNEIIIGKQFDKALTLEEGFTQGELLFVGFAVGKLYNAKILKEYNIRFHEDLSFKEDLVFMLEYLRYCNRIRFIGDTGYKYYVHSGSLSNTKHPVDILIKATRLIISSALFKAHSQHNGVQNCLKAYLRLCLREIFKSIYSDTNTSFQKRRSVLRAVRSLMNNGDIHPTEYKSDRILRILLRKKLFVCYDLLQRILFYFRKKQG